MGGRVSCMRMPAIADASVTEDTSDQEREFQRMIIEFKVREDSLAIREQEVRNREETLNRQLAEQQRIETASVSSPNQGYNQIEISTDPLLLEREQEIQRQRHDLKAREDSLKSREQELCQKEKLLNLNLSKQNDESMTHVFSPIDPDIRLEVPTLTADKDRDNQRHDPDSNAHFDEVLDETEVLKNIFSSLSSGADFIYKSQVEIEFAKKGNDEFLHSITTVLKDLPDDKKIDLTAFMQILNQVPRLQGQRVQWAKSLGLEGELARLLPVGNFVDELQGLKEMAQKDLEEICAQFCKTIWSRVRAGWEKLKEKGVPMSTAEEANSKYSLTDGAFKGTFGSLEDFHKGSEARIGYPNPILYDGMHKEHCLRSNANKLITTPNYNVTTCPSWEWSFVVSPEDRPNPDFEYPHTPMVKDRSEWTGLDATGREKRLWRGHGRKVQPLEDLMKSHEFKVTVEKARLVKDEIIALRLYTGPLYILYNGVLRDYPADVVQGLEGNRYETTLFVIISGVSKLSRVTPIPPSRLLYRGLGGMLLPEQFWLDRGAGFLGGVELGFMSTTTDRRVAIQYSGHEKRRAAIFEIAAGRIDIGGALGFLSQYPGEEEFLMPPLSFLEVMGKPRVETTPNGQLLVFPMRVNANLKSVTVEELTARRKTLHLAMAKNLREELSQRARASLEEFVALDISRLRGAGFEVLRGDGRQVSTDPDAFVIELRSRASHTAGAPSMAVTVGAPSMAVSSGRVYFELEVLELHATLDVGFAGANFRPVAFGAAAPPPPHLGDDAASWHVHNFEGDGKHRGQYCGNCGRMWMLRPGDVVGLACDLAAGALLVGSESHGWRRTAFTSGVAPGPVVGPGLFPALTLSGEVAQVRYNMGGRPFRLKPPSPEYIAVARGAGVGGAQEAGGLAGAFAAARESEAALSACRARFTAAERARAGYLNKLLRLVAGPADCAALESPWTADFAKIGTVGLWDPGAAGGKIYYEVELLALPGEGAFVIAGFAGARFADPPSGQRGDKQQRTVGDDGASWGVGFAGSFGPFRAHASKGGDPDRWGLPWKEGDVIGLACDADAGELRASVNGDFAAPAGLAFADGVRLGPAVGEGLFPVLCGFHARVRCNFGEEPAARPFRHAPPDPEYRAAAAPPPDPSEDEDVSVHEARSAAARRAAAEAAEAHGRALAEELGRLGADGATLDAEFGRALTEHEGLAAGTFNEDAAYKRLLNQLLDLKGHLLHRQAALVALRREGASPAQLRLCALSPSTEFCGQELPERCGYTWRSVLAGGCPPSMELPHDLPSGQLAILWDALLRSGSEEVVVGGVAAAVGDVHPALCVAARGMHISKCCAAVAGLALAAAGTLRRVDLRGNDYPARALLQIVGALSGAASLVSLNGVSLAELPSPRPALRAAVVRAVVVGCSPGAEGFGSFRGLSLDLERTSDSRSRKRQRAVEKGRPLEKRLADMLLRRQAAPASRRGYHPRGGSWNSGGGNSDGDSDGGSDGEGYGESRSLEEARRGETGSGDEEETEEDWVEEGGPDGVAPEPAQLDELDAADWAFVLARVEAVGIRTLDLSEERLGHKVASGLAAPLAGLERLASLRLSKNDFRDAGATALARGLSCLACLRVFKLCRAGLRGAGATALARGLSCLTALEVLALSGNEMGGAGGAVIVQALMQLTALRSVSLREAALGAEGGASVAVFLASAEAATALRALKLGGNAMGAEQCAAAAASFQRCAALQTLDLGGNDAGESGGAAAGRALARLTGLEVLDLSSNGLKGEAVVTVAASLQGLTGLRVLRLRDEKLAPAQWEPLLASLRGCCMLEQLDDTELAKLDKLTGISGAWAALLGGGLTRLRFGYMFNKPSVDAGALGGLLALNADSLAVLDLSYNDLASRRAAAVCGGVGALSALRTLELGSNFMEAGGMRMLAPGLRRLTALQQLDLRENRLRASGCEAACEAVRALTGLTRLDIGNNELGWAECRAVAAAVSAHSALLSLHLSKSRLGGTQPQGRRGSPTGFTADGAAAEEALAKAQAVALAQAAALAQEIARVPGLQELSVQWSELDEGAKPLEELARGLEGRLVPVAGKAGLFTAPQPATDASASADQDQHLEAA